MRLLAGTHIIKLNTVDSTNSFSKDYLRLNPTKAQGVAIIAENQTAGRGQQGNVWLSEPGKNLTCSLIVNINFINPSHLFYLTKAVSVAICNYLSTLTILPKIKWPNDIYVLNKKLGGLLIEVISNRPFKQTAIIGIGLNINQLHWPEHINATSFFLIKGKEYSVYSVFDELLNYIDAAILSLKNDMYGFDKLYLEYLLGLNEDRFFEHQSQLFKGQIKGVNAQGKLIVYRNDLCLLKEYDLKEIKFVF
jgi:BirA family biotin operon repressor/biotin-[acetyl-CoA-carboxylase] ligase